jgi:hypothetical protein
MPAQEVNQPQVQQMDISQTDAQQPVSCSHVVVDPVAPETSLMTSHIPLSVYLSIYLSTIYTSSLIISHR